MQVIVVDSTKLHAHQKTSHLSRWCPTICRPRPHSVSFHTLKHAIFLTRMMMIVQSLNGLLLLLRQADVGQKLYEMRERLQEDVTKLQV
jgi:hypothetical protein